MTYDKIRRSASGARQGGDDYQHLVAWNRILRALLPHRQLLEVELEAVGAGNVDDVVVHYQSTPSQYAQVRYAVYGTTPLNSGYLLDRTERRLSMLQKFHKSFDNLRSMGSPELILITNRLVDPTDPVLTALDSRTGLLVPAMATAGVQTPLGTTRAAWAAHLECHEDALVDLMGSLQFWLGRPYGAEEQYASDYMAAHGLRYDLPAVRLGIDRVRRWVLDGFRKLSAATITDGIAELGIEVGDPAAILHVQALLRDPTATDATEALDWVDLFAGSQPAERRATIDPDAYVRVMQPGLETAAEKLIAAGHHRVVIRGATRLASSFAVGAMLPRVRNLELSRHQGAAHWTTDAEPREPRPELTSTVTDVGKGNDLGVVLGIATDHTRAVLKFIESAGLSIKAALTITPSRGPDDTFVRDDHDAVAITQEVRRLTRMALGDRTEVNVHLFLACPAALATILGHRWNRVAPTIVYEDIITGYQPAFRIAA